MIPDSMFLSPRTKWTPEDFDDPVKREAMLRQTEDESNRAAEKQVRALLAAGWQFEIVSESAVRPWQWAWRRPPRIKGKPGRRFASTNQAWRALMREQGELND